MNYAVIGLGFGDEGKGITTDYAVSQCYRSPVINVRFSGGQQAGHNVVDEKLGINHVFSNFGSATLKGIPTYWSEFCSVCPQGIMKELSILKSKGLYPKLYINGDAPVTTRYDAHKNREIAVVTDHGTCGVGVGQTFQREEDFHHLTFSDLFYADVFKEKLRLIKNYYGQAHTSVSDLTYFLKMCKQLIKSDNVELVYDLPEAKDYIFESSQGLLLDQHYGFFPNVTRSNVGTKNINKILGDNQINKYFLVTRAYQTRHGNGFMTNENIDFEIYDNPNETNVTNGWQGEFRKTMLDVTLLEYGINKDKTLRENLNRCTLVVTCLDHLDTYAFSYRDNVFICEDENDFVEQIKDILDITHVIISSSPDSKYFKYSK